MVSDTIGALTIGQTPRPDLLALLAPVAAHYDVRCRGALDGLRASNLPAVATYPLVTRLRSGRLVRVEEAFLTPLLQRALDGLEEEGVLATVLLCAGEFEGLAGSRPLVRPYQLGACALDCMGFSRLAVVVPTDGQRAAAGRKWRRAGFVPSVWSEEERPDSAPHSDWLQKRLAREADLSALVFDYVGYPDNVLQRVRSSVGLPVLDLGHLAADVLRSILCIPLPRSV